MRRRTRSTSIGSIAPEFILLGCLAVQPAHGYELHQRLHTDLGHLWHLSQSQVYSILARLEREGMLTQVVEPQGKLPDRRYCYLTPSGRSHFERWLYEPTQGGVQSVRLNFISRLYFAQLLDKDAVPHLIQGQVVAVEEMLARLQAALAAIPPEQVFNCLGLELRVRHLLVTRDWLAECANRLAGT